MIHRLTTIIAFFLTFMALHVTAADLPVWIQKSRPVGAPALSIPAIAKINSAINSKGTAKIIVRLTAPPSLAKGFAIEGNLKSAESVNNQRANISQVQNNVASKLSKAHGVAAKRFDFIPFMAMEVDLAEFSVLAASSEIDLIEEDIPVPPTLAQSVPIIGGVSGAFNGFTGSGQTVAILDTGVDKTHPFLTGKVVSEACYSTSDSTATAVCASNSTISGSGANCSSSLEGCDHGTHVAGIVAGKGASFSGVAKDATLIAIQVFSQFPASECGEGATTPCVMSYTSDQIKALNRVYILRNTYNISSVNMSLGGGSYSSNCDTDSDYTAEKAAIDTLRSVGIATIIASGNEHDTSSISGPACISSAISVGATTKSDLVASYSNSASILTVLAPGSSINSSIPGGIYELKDGTSMATPHVAGAWAVLKSAMPTASVSEVLNALTSTGKSITDTRNSIVTPRIQLDSAVNILTGGQINGACGISHNQAFSVIPTSNLCFSTGSISSTVIGSGPWSWTCSGLNGGVPANCMAYSTSQQVTLVTQNFDSAVTPALPSGWTSIGAGIWRTNNETVHPTGIASHSPSNLVYFNSWTVSSGVTAFLASPTFSLSGKMGGKVSFWMYHDAEYINDDRVDIYVNTISNLSGASLIGTVDRYIGADGWYNYTFNIPATFTGASNYLILNGVSDFGNDMHLDDVTVYAYTPSPVTLNFSFAGTGYGSVNSAPTGIACTGTAGDTCAPKSYTSGTPVAITASPNSSSSFYSTFSGWTTNTTPCSGTGPCSVTMNSSVSVTGNFTRDKLVKNSSTSLSHSTISEAFEAAAPSGQIIQVRDNSGLTPFTDALTVTKSVTLKGGFAAGFGTNTGYTTSNGKLTIGNGGVLRVERIFIK